MSDHSRVKRNQRPTHVCAKPRFAVLNSYDQSDRVTMHTLLTAALCRCNKSVKNYFVSLLVRQHIQQVHIGYNYYDGAKEFHISLLSVLIINILC